MTPLKTILVVLDKPKHDQTALQRAIPLARAAGAHLHLASFCWLPMVAQTDVFDAHQRRVMKKSALNERRRWLDALVADRGLADADLSTEVAWTRDISDWVADHATQAKADLVVKSVHHSRSLLHTPLDWQLLRQCPAPILLVSTRRHKASGNVLATVDLNTTDSQQRMNQRVLDSAARFAELQNGELHCANVVEFAGSLEERALLDASTLHKHATDHAPKLLHALLAQHEVAQDRIHVSTGKVGQAIAEMASKVDAELIVVGTGVRRSLGAVLLGSSAEKILTRTASDVLVVHV